MTAGLYSDDETSPYYNHSQASLLDLADRGAQRVLEIGCGTGVTLAHCKRAGANFVAGVELFPAAAEVAGQRPEVDLVIAGDFTLVDMPFGPGEFDLIIVSHVLEHIVNPWAGLDLLVTYLRAGGQLIGSLPNIRHQAVLRKLVLAGRFDYTDDGVLDRTHLRFFTRASIEELLRNANLDPEIVVGEIGGRRSKVADRLTGGLFQNLLAYAYNFSARRPK